MVSNISFFNKNFQQNHLKEIYEDYISHSHAYGIDNINNQKFKGILDKEIEIIYRKTYNASYKFTKYKLKLISKGREKSPREISIPTIRDKITLKALCCCLQEIYQKDIQFDLPQSIIKKIKNYIQENPECNYFIKLDIINFYPSIQHEILIAKLKKRTKSNKILHLVQNAISTPTVSKSVPSDTLSAMGVPQGLSISNILAYIYLFEIDQYFLKQKNILYFRYVDDIIILCNQTQLDKIKKQVKKRLQAIKLEIHDSALGIDKSSYGDIHKNNFSYLGYYFQPNNVSVRATSIQKLRESLIAMFVQYHNQISKNIHFLEWRLNLRITGCVFKEQSKGWMFFFSEITDIKLLHQLDSFIQKLCKRFNVDLQLKLFVRTFFQIQHNRRETIYIPNFDKYDIEQKKHVIKKYFNKDVSNMTDKEIENYFDKKILRQVKDMEIDISIDNYII
ncbi:reverse transcriptase/maturase family protein [Commensalibacter communis]|uniref:reverse transcriptase/maturase family protein n=1 Tax=Commensalibacter communis TaxID=2972786 RepID=UPI0022FF72F0|nr:reverse transcriptase/maturase family protein [Commensalibacter communis]CAI3949961.1 Retron-type reverse transcriptase (YkfC) [Commensalibacter communis]CAI3956547.1 Retron-type reverse transcriptase (YkfC) [Commensalibacter communis]